MNLDKKKIQIYVKQCLGKQKFIFPKNIIRLINRNATAPALLPYRAKT